MTLFSSVSLLHVYQMGLFPGASCWFALVRNLTTWRVSRTIATVLVSVIIAEQKAPMVWLTLTRVCGTTAPRSKLTSLLLRAHQSASVPPASASHDCDGVALQEECTDTCTESYEAKSSATTLTTQICHVDGWTYADTGLQFTSCVTTTLLQCSDSTIAQTWVALLATSLLLATVLERSRVSARTRALPGSLQVTCCSASTNPVAIGVSGD